MELGREDSQLYQLDQPESATKTHCHQQSKNCINIKFTDIVYSVNEWSINKQITRVNRFPFKNENKIILNKISGYFQANQLTGILGSSGCGKSSLLDIISGFSKEDSGEVLLNGKKDDQRHNKVGYVMQDSALHPLLTVSEAMMFSAQLKLGQEFPDDEKKTIVQRILTTLELTCPEQLTKDLSKGQYKRLAIGLELLNNPPIMFFDEPTTGLDYHMAKKCMAYLRGLAGAGHTVVCTLHQPSYTILDMLDLVYVVVEGRCVYQGAVKALMPFCDRLGESCPTTHNPADHIIDVAVGIDSQAPCIDKMVELVGNGKNQDWCTANQSVDGSFETLESTNAYDEKLDKFNRGSYFHTQFITLLKRSFKILQRNKHYTLLQLFIHVTMGFLFGVLYFGVGNDAFHTIENFNLMFFSLIFLMFTALSSAIMTFPVELPIIIREHFNHWYSLRSYYLALTFTEVPLQVVCTSLFCGVVYLMTQQPLELFRFGLFLLLLVTVTLFSQAVGVLFGSLFNITHAMVLGPLAILPGLIFSGLFLRMSDTLPAFRWLFHISHLKYAFEGLILAIYGYDRARMPCSGDFCYFVFPWKLLKRLEIEEASYTVSLLVIFLLYLATKAITYFVLRYRLTHKRELNFLPFA